MNVSIFNKKTPQPIKSFLEFCVISDDEIICSICKNLTSDCFDIMEIFDNIFLEHHFKNKIPNKQEYFICEKCLEKFFNDMFLKIEKINDEKMQAELSKRSLEWFEEIGLLESLPNCPTCNGKLIIQTIMGGHVCVNPECEEFIGHTVFCYHVKYCKGIANQDYSWSGSTKHDELSNVCLCDECIKSCNCIWDDYNKPKMMDKGKIKKIDELCPRHGIKRRMNVTAISGVTSSCP